MRARTVEAWLWIACAVAVVVGVLIGNWIYGVSILPNLAALFAMVAGAALLIGLAALVVAGAVLMAFGKEAAGGAVMLIAASTGLGAVIGFMILGYAYR